MKSCFVLAESIGSPPHHFAATTRPREPGRYGLPGGKVDAGESLREAVIRESREEGFRLHGLDQKPFYSALVGGNPVHWFRARYACALPEYKERGRVYTTALPLSTIRLTGYGNDGAVAEFLRQESECDLCAQIGGYCGSCNGSHWDRKGNQ